MRLVAIAPPSFEPLEALRREAPGIEIIASEDLEKLRSDVRGAEVILLAPRHGRLLTDLWRDLTSTKWIHALGAGVEALPLDLLRRSEIIVTNSRGLYADALGEFAIAGMLWFAKDLRRLVRNQAARRWERLNVERLEGKTVGIIGYGGIGQAVGRRVTALGMRVISVRRQQEFGDASIDDVIAEADYLVLSTPLTPSTFHLLNRERIAAMRPDAVLINVSRGQIVDESALAEALLAKKIRGAALDVFETEPLPVESPLWALENVLLSPHSADHTADSHQRAMTFFIENLRRYQRGESLENVVDKEQGY
ncbi:MAG TPA: D-2-hydroxyacid dehydrogenase [Thermoanaerobaculia bacterium]|nr:D-2-hydroxyacid dehydrogenase [Thermoanaerobaculia bacterium]